MPLNLNDLIKKAKDKGLEPSFSNNKQLVLKPWQQESILFETDNEQETNRKQTNNKLITNRQQTDNKNGNKPITNRQQTDNEQEQTRTKPTTKPTTQPTTNWKQTDNQPQTNVCFSSLVGLQREIIIFIYNACKIVGSKITESLTLEHIATSLNTSKGCVKTTIQRLEAKGCVKRNSFKNGRGGWSRYRIPDLLFQELLQYETYSKLVTNRKQSDINTATEQTTQQATSSYIVSSSYINTTTIPEEFKNIDCSPLKDIGFDESHIIQIYREHNQKPNLALSAEIIQNSINALAFDLKYNNAASSFKASPAVVLTAMLKKGQPYSSKTPEKVLSPREAAMQEYLLAQEQKNLKIMETETKAFELARKEWLGSLSEEELLSFNEDENICPANMHEKIYQISRRQQALANAKKYFDNIIWPQKLKEIVDKNVPEQK